MESHVYTDWRDRVKEYQQKTKTDNVITTDVAAGKAMHYLGLQLFFDQVVAKECLDRAKGMLSKELQNKIHWQDKTVLHMTIQSTLLSDQLSVDSVPDNLIRDISETINSIKSTTGNLIYPFFAQTGIFCFYDDQEFTYQFRKLITEVWHKNDFEPSVKQEFWDFPTVILGRFTQKISPSELSALLTLSPTEVETEAKNLKLCLSDKFISSDTVKVVSEFHLQ